MCIRDRHRPIRVCGLQSILDALDVLHAAVVEGGAEGDHQQLVVANVVLIAGIVLGSIAGVTALSLIHISSVMDLLLHLDALDSVAFSGTKAEGDVYKRQPTVGVTAV